MCRSSAQVVGTSFLPIRFRLPLGNVMDERDGFFVQRLELRRLGIQTAFKRREGFSPLLQIPG